MLFINENELINNLAASGKTYSAVVIRSSWTRHEPPALGSAALLMTSHTCEGPGSWCALLLVIRLQQFHMNSAASPSSTQQKQLVQASHVLANGTARLLQGAMHQIAVGLTCVITLAEAS